VENIDRKTISRSIDSLIDIGIDIVKLDGGGCYLAERELEPSEVTFLIDAIFSSRALNQKQAKDLSKKLSQMLSIYQRDRFKYVHKSDEIVRTDNKQLFLNIDLISEAIEKGKQISFNYDRHYFADKKIAEQKEKEYIINPYFMVNNQGKYYLVCNYDYFDSIANYKVEQIKNVKILDTDIKPITKLKGRENGLDKAKYINENIYMFSTNTITATIKIEDEYAVNYVYDWFGKDARVYSQDGVIMASVRVNELAIIYWCLQYGESVELVSPVETRNKIKEIVSQMNKKYS
jgi:predicted DNA-binding transcriptional regulator YafY